jgi:hypothetical protein
MRSRRDDITGMLYEEIGEGLIRVTNGARTGTFRAMGEWVEGDQTEADLHMLEWVGGQNIAPALRGHVRIPTRTLHHVAAKFTPKIDDGD